MTRSALASLHLGPLLAALIGTGFEAASGAFQEVAVRDQGVGCAPRHGGSLERRIELPLLPCETTPKSQGLMKATLDPP